MKLIFDILFGGVGVMFCIGLACCMVEIIVEAIRGIFKRG